MQKSVTEFGSAGADALAVTLVAGPFTTAARLRGFVRAVEALPGLYEVRILALQQERLSLLLPGADATSLLEQLRTLPGFPFDVEDELPGSLAIHLRDSPEPS